MTPAKWPALVVGRVYRVDRGRSVGQVFEVDQIENGWAWVTLLAVAGGQIPGHALAGKCRVDTPTRYRLEISDQGTRAEYEAAHIRPTVTQQVHVGWRHHETFLHTRPR